MSSLVGDDVEKPEALELVNEQLEDEGFIVDSVLFTSLDQLATQDPKTFAGLGSSKAGTEERKAACSKLRDLIAATAQYPGVTGTITLDANRDATKPAVVIEIKDGKKVFRTSIAAPTKPA